MNLKVKGLDGKVYPWYPRSNRSTIAKQSSYYVRAKQLIKLLYPTDPLLEEVSLPGTRPTLFADFFLIRRRTLIEVHGEQHYESLKNFEPSRFNPTRLKLAAAKRNDMKKKNWCNINQFYYVELPYFEDIHAWRCRIENTGLDSPEREKGEA